MVIQEQAEPDQPGRALVLVMRQDKTHRPDNVRRGAQEDFPLDQRFPHEGEIIHFQIAQPAMDQFCAGGGCVLGEVILFNKDNVEATPGGIAGNARPIYAPADDEQVVHAAPLAFHQAGGLQEFAGAQHPLQLVFG
jgi:hypothetical protein